MPVAPAEATAASSVHSLEQVRALAQDYNLIPLCETFIDDCQTPVSAFLKLREDGPAFLLEPADQGRVGHSRPPAIRARALPRRLGDCGRRRSPVCPPSRVVRWACSPTTSCARWSRLATPNRTRSASPPSRC